MRIMNFLTRSLDCSRRLKRPRCRRSHHRQFPSDRYSRLPDAPHATLHYHWPAALLTGVWPLSADAEFAGLLLTKPATNNNAVSCWWREEKHFTSTCRLRSALWELFPFNQSINQSIDHTILYSASYTVLNGRAIYLRVEKLAELRLAEDVKGRDLTATHQSVDRLPQSSWIGYVGCNFTLPKCFTFMTTQCDVGATLCEARISAWRRRRHVVRRDRQRAPVDESDV